MRQNNSLSKSFQHGTNATEEGMTRYKSITRFLQNNDKFILTSHETPDGDAVGSECAMFAALNYLGKKVLIFNADPAADKYRYLSCSQDIHVLEDETQLPGDIGTFVLLIMDTNDIHNIGQVADIVLPRVKEYFIIDHHESDDDIIMVNHIEDSASSTCEILYALFRHLDIPITLPMANSLYTGIVYDTGSFIYPKTSAETFRIAHELVKTGVEPYYIYSRIYESNSVSALQLQAKVLSSLELLFDQQVAVLTMTHGDIVQCGALYEEADTLINIPLKSERIKVSLFFKENETGILRCSLRSKGDINVAEIAQHYGGGGHKTAAGFKSKYPLETIKQKVLDKLARYFEDSM
jgi:phosphoesterase RecJ-like protein